MENSEKLRDWQLFYQEVFFKHIGSVPLKQCKSTEYRPLVIAENLEWPVVLAACRGAFPCSPVYFTDDELTEIRRPHRT